MAHGMFVHGMWRDGTARARGSAYEGDVCGGKKGHKRRDSGDVETTLDGQADTGRVMAPCRCTSQWVWDLQGREPIQHDARTQREISTPSASLLLPSHPTDLSARGM